MAKKSQELSEVVPETPSDDQNPIEVETSAESGGSDQPNMSMIYDGEPISKQFDISRLKGRLF